MSEDSKKLVKYFRTSTAWIVGIVLVASIAALTIIAWTYHRRQEMAMGILCEVTVVSSIYLLAYWFLDWAKSISRRDELLAALTEFGGKKCLVCPMLNTIPWPMLFDGATEISLMVQGWDKWPELVQEQLPAFWARGGKINLILLDPSQDGLLEHAGLRLDRSVQDMKKEITKTVEYLEESLRAVAPYGDPTMRIRRIYTKRMNWYCGIYFKTIPHGPGKLLLSLYQHKPHDRRSPSFIVQDWDSPGIVSWFLTDWKWLEEDEQTQAAAFSPESTTI